MNAPPLAMSLGDAAGIGPDIAIAAWRLRRENALPAFAVIGGADILRDRAAQLGLDCPVSDIADLSEAADAFARALPVLALDIAAPPCAPGHPDPRLAPLTIGSIREAVALTLAGRASGVVTNPISKAVLYDAGFAYPGHTEFLAALAREAGFAAEPVMMLSSAELKVVPATVHMALRDAPDAITRARLATVIAVTAEGLGRWFGLTRPRIAVAGLNPHAGEDGAMGREEIDVIRPAIEEARAKGYEVTGPWPADTLFHAEARAGYDAVIAMYHDQALAPFKTIAFDTGVNVTLGLPFIRTSPDHGTAFALAGTGRASASSLIEAIRLADRMRRAQPSPP
jgi:4-hydroxythreonine-4-phosphate dehydrogenase